MSARGAPFRFLGAVTVCWIGARVALLLPETGSLPEAVKALVPRAAAAGPPPPAETSPRVAHQVQAARPAIANARRSYVLTNAHAAVSDPLSVQLALMGLVQYGEPAGGVVPTPTVAMLPAAAIPDRIDPLPDRWSASGWFVARGGRGIGAVPGGGQLGGAQAGLRVAYLLSARDRIAALARVTTPLAGEGREAAVGIEWQPSRANLRIVAEQRLGLDGTPGGPGLGVVAGVDDDIGRFRLEAYGQAGAIARRRIEPYADGAARITRAAGGTDSPLSLGLGAWGGAQRDAARLDVGPSAVLTMRPVRVSLDWRQRVAGRAWPGSGLALTLGGDF